MVKQSKCFWNPEVYWKIFLKMIEVSQISSIGLSKCGKICISHFLEIFKSGKICISHFLEIFKGNLLIAKKIVIFQILKIKKYIQLICYFIKMLKFAKWMNVYSFCEGWSVSLINILSGERKAFGGTTSEIISRLLLHFF